MKLLKIMLECIKKKVIYVILFIIFSIFSMYLMTYLPIVISYGINHIMGNNDSIYFLDTLLKNVNDVKIYLVIICLILLFVQGIIKDFNMS